MFERAFTLFSFDITKLAIKTRSVFVCFFQSSSNPLRFKHSTSTLCFCHLTHHCSLFSIKLYSSCFQRWRPLTLSWLRSWGHRTYLTAGSQKSRNTKAFCNFVRFARILTKLRVLTIVENVIDVSLRWWVTWATKQKSFFKRQFKILKCISLLGPSLHLPQQLRRSWKPRSLYLVPIFCCNRLFARCNNFNLLALRWSLSWLLCLL